MKNHVRMFVVGGVIFLLALSVCGTAFVSTVESQDFQKVPIILRASEVLSKDLLMGPNYKVVETVKNDGFVNAYEVDTNYGPLRVESTALLLKRINELRALSKIEDLKGTDVYLKAAKDAALGPLRTATGVVTDPLGTASGIVSGIGNFFGKAGDAITSSSSDKDKALNSILGQSAFKREFAYQFGIDPYTSYEPLQKALNDLAWTSAVGGLTAKAAFMAIPGAVGAVVGYSGTADTTRTLVRDKTPPELDKMNRKSLRSMGVDDGLASLFLSTTSYGPQEKTFLVGALASMAGVTNRRIFVELATMECEEPVALFMRVRAQMMGQYFEKARDVDRFVSAGGVPVLLTKGGVVVGIFPLDHVAWSASFAQKGMSVSDAIDKMQGIKGKELWIAGTVDPMARSALENRGWKVEDRVAEKLLKK
jgi:hypothetical protein